MRNSHNKGAKGDTQHVFRQLAAFAALIIAPLVCDSAAAAQPAPSSTPIPQQVPAPTATTTPHPSGPIPGLPGLTINGTLRAYDFARENQVQNAANPNRTAFNFGGSLHLDYALRHTPLHVATTYFGAYPFGANGLRPQRNGQIDNTVPGFAMSTFDEAYLRYKDTRTSVTAGDQVINTPWTPTSDTRLKPVAFQGLDASYAFGPYLALGVSRMIRFEGRTSSAFDRNTLLTSQAAGQPSYTPHNTSGFLLADLMIKPNKNVTASLNNYSFYDIANFFYGEVRGALAPDSPYNPTVAVQYVNEVSEGRRLIGRVLNNTYGVQLATNLNRNVLFQTGFDTAPVRYDTVAATSVTAAGRGIFLPAGGTPTAAALGGGVYRIAYGGIASPYSDSYATDPLFTTSISQGMADRHSPGTSYKAGLTFTPDNKRVRGIISEAYYDYGNELGSNRTYETNVDVTYFFSPVKKGAYKGLAFRERFADRQQPTIPLDFKYIRTQLEYDF